MNDPYEVLGVSRTATEDEIKAAYRRLAKQYHPDLHPGDEAAAQRMNEINAAYDAIKNPQPQRQYQASGSAGYDSYGYDPFGFDPFGYAERRQYRTQYETRDSSDIQSALHFINAGAYQQALHVLSGVDQADRDGRWYYCSARANYGLGNRVAAMEHIRAALRLEPDNLDYQRFYQLMQAGGRAYSASGSRYGFGRSDGNYCGGLCLAWCLCNACMGGNYYWFCC